MSCRAAAKVMMKRNRLMRERTTTKKLRRNGHSLILLNSNRKGTHRKKTKVPACRTVILKRAASHPCRAKQQACFTEYRTGHAKVRKDANGEKHKTNNNNRALENAAAGKRALGLLFTTNSEYKHEH